MALIPFTNREMRRAWQANLEASSHVLRSNAHRLLLFYAIECGLKAVLMKRRSVTCTIHCREFGEVQHDINKLLDILSAGQSLKLPNRLNMTSININKAERQERNLYSNQVNQVWRYGGKVMNIIDKNGNTENLTDEELEQHLIRISQWIQRELGQL